MEKIFENEKGFLANNLSQFHLANLLSWRRRKFSHFFWNYDRISILRKIDPYLASIQSRETLNKNKY
jgi:hypothetical protein